MNRHWASEILDTILRAILRTALICLVIYGLYVLKSAVGINLSHRYHAIDVFSQPVNVITDIIQS